MSGPTVRTEADQSLGRLIGWIVGTLALLGLGAALAELISPPAYFMAMAAVSLVLALVALYQSFLGVFGRRSTTATGLRASLPERAALIEEKNALLRAIKDIAYEREVGKLSEPDFQRLDRAYRLRAKEVLRKLDEDLAPFLERAEQLVADALEKRKAKSAEVVSPGSAGSGDSSSTSAEVDERPECPKCRTRNRPEAEWCKECGGRIAPLICVGCEAENDPDAKFCIKCAADLGTRPEHEGTKDA